MPVTEQDIHQWLEGCKEGHRSAQEKLYRHFYPLFMPVCMSYVQNSDDAVDIYNRAFLKVFTSLDSYGGRGQVGAWIRRILVNTAIDFIRKEEKFKSHTDIDEAYDIGLNSSVLSQLTSDEILALFRYLPPAQRAVVNLYIVEGYTHPEIGEKLGISVGTSKWHLNQGRKLLQEKLMALGLVNK
jgi:RNA polymerase sigma-70 factor (ECF subfamily)